MQNELGSDFATKLNNFTDENPLTGSQEVCYQVFAYYDVIKNSEPALFCNPVKVFEHIETGINMFSYQNTVIIENTNLVPVQSVSIVDIFGRVVWQGQAADARTAITLNVATGIYIARIITADNRSLTAKVRIIN
jgi:hypothetical protein